MINKAPLDQAYRLIKKNRNRRKMHMYKLAFSVMVDRTTAFYLLLLGGYIFVSLFIIGDLISDYDEQFAMIEAEAAKRYWLFLTILPLRYINRSFKRPGIIFSTSEYQLSLLPFSRGEIWVRSATEKWLKSGMIYMVLGSLIIFITPISALLVLKYMLLLISFDILMTIPQWTLYQKRLHIKIVWLCLMIMINGIGIWLSFYTNIPLVGLLVVGLILLINIQLKDRLFNNVQWSKVTEISDFQLWNMWLISKASEVKITRQKKYSMFQKIGIGKKPFTYQGKNIYHRLWVHYLGKNIGLLLQAIGVIFAMLIVFLFLSEWLFYVGIVIAIYVYTTVHVIFFTDHFEADMLTVLPWDLPGYKQSYFKWAIIGGVVLLIPIGIFFTLHPSIWVPFQLLFFCSAFLYLYDVKMEKTIVLIGKESPKSDLDETISILLLASTFLTWKYPQLSLGVIIVIWLLFRRRKGNVLA